MRCVVKPFLGSRTVTPVDCSAASTRSTEAVGSFCLRIGHAPATCGAAIDVPLNASNRPCEIDDVMSIPGASRTFTLRTVNTTLEASKTKTVRVKLSRKVIRAAKRALKKHKRVTATVNVTARDSAGNLRGARRSIRIRK